MNPDTTKPQLTLRRMMIPLVLAAQLVSSACAADSWTTIRAGLPDDLRTAIWNGSEYLAIGRRGNLYASPDGVKWTSKGLGPKVPVNRFLLHDGEYLVVGDSGIHRSVDLQTWTREYASQAPLWGISAWSDTVLAVGDSGQILRRIGSGSWESIVSGTRNRLYFASKALGAYYVGGTSWLAMSPNSSFWSRMNTNFSEIYWLEAVGKSLVIATYTGASFSRDSGRMWKSVAGTWTGIPTRVVHAGNQVLVPTTTGNINLLAGDSASTQVRTPLGDVQDIAAGGPNFVAVGRDGRIAYASDPKEWKTEYHWQNSVSYAGGKWFISSVDTNLYSSTNGWDWQTNSTSSRIVRKIIETPKGFMTYGKQASASLYESDRYIFSSADALVWEDNFSVQIRQIRDIARFGSQVFFVATYGGAARSTDERSWTALTFDTNIDLKKIFIANDRIFLCGDSLYTSTDGTNWTLFNIPYKLGPAYTYVESMVHTGKEYVASSRGFLYYSNDGINWTPEVNGTLFQWNNLFWNGKEIVALTDGGLRFATSPDGHSWTVAPDSLPEPIVDIAVHGTKAMAIGNHGTVLVLGDFPTASTQVRRSLPPRKTGSHSIDGRILSPETPRALGAPRY